MIFNNAYDSLVKTTILSVLGAALLTACGDSGTTTKTPANGAQSGQTSAYEVAGDHALGKADAPITIVEYASVTCPHCADWTLNVFPHVRTKYIDTGKVRYVFREFPTPPADLAMVGHLIANCAPDEKYFEVLHVQFKRQRQILGSSDIKGEYVNLAKSAGMSEADFETCMSNETEIARLNDVIRGGVDAGVTGTPTFFVNGKKESIYTVETFDKRIAELLGEPIPEAVEDADTNTEKTEH